MTGGNQGAPLAKRSAEESYTYPYKREWVKNSKGERGYTEDLQHYLQIFTAYTVGR